MAIIVDKVQKRKDIALACVNLFIQGGIAKLTISEVAKTAGIGKGTFYDYYQNKDAIVFEILTILLEQHSATKKDKIDNVISTRNKVKVFFDFFYNEEDQGLRQLYKEYLSISLSNPTTEMMQFQTQCVQIFSSWLENILNEAISKNEIIPQAHKLARGLFFFGDGAFLSYSTTNNIENLEKEISVFIDAIFDLIEVKK